MKNKQAAIKVTLSVIPQDEHWIEQVEKAIQSLSSAQQEHKKGKWVRHNTYHGDDTSGFVDPDWRCSECGKQANINEWLMYDLTDYCPNCGADMRSEMHSSEKSE